MARFKRFINEQANTLGADVNEIMFGYFVLGGTWKGFEKSSEAKKHVETRKGEIEAKINDPDEYNNQIGRAKVMADMFLKWSQSNGYTGMVKKVWWTAREGVLAKAVGKDINSKKNPTDILVQFNNGTFLGVSAKSTKGSGDITFKNPGVGTVDRELKIHPSLMDLYKNLEKEIVEKYNLPLIGTERKKLYKKDPKVKLMVRPDGRIILGKLRDVLLETLKKLDSKKAVDYILDSWMDAKNSVYPPYIKITGHGKGKKFTSKISNPLKNDMLSNLMKGNLSFEPVASDTIGVLSNDSNRIIKIRIKYGNGPLIGIKMVGDPWK